MIEDILERAKKWANYKCYYTEYIDDAVQEYMIRAVYALNKVDTNKSKNQQLHYCCKAGSFAGIRFIQKIAKHKSKIIAMGDAYEDLV